MNSYLCPPAWSYEPEISYPGLFVTFDIIPNFWNFEHASEYHRPI